MASIAPSSGPLSVFGNPPEYRQLNSGAHRKRSTNFEAPALTWHMAFWIPPAPPNEKKTHTRLKNSIDSLILSACRKLKSDPQVTGVRVTPSINGSIILFEQVVDSTSLQPQETNLSERQKDVREGDYRVVSVKFRWRSVEFTVRTELHTEYFSFTTFAELHHLQKEHNEDLWQHFSALKELLETGSSKLASQLPRFFYEEFWSQAAPTIFGSEDLRSHLSENILSQIFADFRGIVLSEEAVSFPFSSRKDGAPSWGYEAELKFFPLVTAAERYEYTASYMLDERAFYMTALGPQSPEDHDHRRIPLTYLLYVHQHFDDPEKTPINKWQLGRLVDRMHLLGTLRLAGLRDFAALRAAGHTLSKLDPYVTDARDSVAAHRTNGSRDDAITKIELAHEHFNKITKQYRESTKSAPGLLYRIERSRYYTEQFRANIRALRLSRIEGSQRYDDFVDRRLGAVFDYINRLGLRYERAINSLLMLDQNYLAIRTNKIEGEVRGIQRYADLALIGALLPYYLVGQLSHALHEPHGPFVPVLTAALSSLCFAAGIYRFVESERNEKRKKIIRSIVAFVFAAAVWAAIPALNSYVNSITGNDRKASEAGGVHAPAHAGPNGGAVDRPHSAETIEGRPK